MNAGNPEDLIRQLNGSAQPDAGRGVYPPYLDATSRRETAARQLRLHLSNNEFARASLLRASLVDADEDVRKAAVIGLFHSRSVGLETLLVAVAFDPDAAMRQLALESLHALGSPLTTVVAARLSDDSDPDIAQLAKDVLSGKQVRYYQLEGP